jgi:uncharacterized protein YdeI (YjbR/CyaY-like superfamily)
VEPRTKPTFFATSLAFRAWLEKHHSSSEELLVGFYKKATGRPSLTWPESVDQALCFGWIDGVRKRLDDVSYAIRFTPRRPGSSWSAINIARVRALKARGLMRTAGLDAFGRRHAERSRTHSYEQRYSATLAEEHQETFRANKGAWAFFRAQAPSYQRTMTYWVVSAKKLETRERRLKTLIEASARGRRAL